MFLFLGLFCLGFDVIASQPSPFSYCNGNVAYCLSAQVIVQCTLSTNGSSFLQPGTCYDILSNPLSGALCAESGPGAGDATCFINGEPPVFPTPSGGTVYQPPTLIIVTTIIPPTQTPTDIPGPGDPCYGDVSFCLPPGEFNGTLSEILTCNGTNLVPHDCNDYLDYPPNGAVCLFDSFIDGKAVCAGVGQPTPALRTPSGGTLIIPTASGQLPITPLAITASSTSAQSSASSSVSVSASSVSTSSSSTSLGSSGAVGGASASATHSSEAGKLAATPVVKLLSALGSVIGFGQTVGWFMVY
jgi:hypothetical protein